jgi:hypothetical protein
MPNVTDLDIHALMESLAQKRPIFHSEADFQHALAWEAHLLLPDTEIRLEQPVVRHRVMHVDLCLMGGGGKVAIELKYKKRGIDVRVADERFDLRSHNAPDVGRDEFLKDVCRLEQIVEGDSCTLGYAILLTNDESFWREPKRRDTNDREFRIHEGRQISGRLDWHTREGAGSEAEDQYSITLTKTYTAHWRYYSRVSAEGGGEFRYLVFCVRSPSGPNPIRLP